MTIDINVLMLFPCFVQTDTKNGESQKSKECGIKYIIIFN